MKHRQHNEFEEQGIAGNPMLDDDEAPTVPVRRTLPRPLPPLR